jgi:hypothetical protein
VTDAVTRREKVRAAAERYGAPGNYLVGANIAGFIKVVDAMLDQGLVQGVATGAAMVGLDFLAEKD